MHEEIKDWEARVDRLLDEQLMREGQEYDEIHTACEQNGSDLTEDDVVFGWFNRVRES